MNYTIERITETNYNKFDDMVFYRENGFQREPSNAPISRQITEQLNNPDFYVYAVNVENRFVGWISITYIPKIGSRWNGKGHIYVDELWVAPDYRNNGFAKAFAFCLISLYIALLTKTLFFVGLCMSRALLTK